MDAVTRRTDPFAIDGKFAAPDEHARLLVIGGGAAGLAAATEAAKAGISVVLIDENPVPAALMGLDVPLFYGQRMNAAVQEEARMVERLVASSPAVEAAFDAGVDVRLGTACWGVFANGPALNALPCPVAGLTDGTKTWMCGYDALILATGARDLVLSFPGVERPGVMGALGFASLLGRYDAFSGRRVVILGSGELAVATATLARARGVEVAGMVEVLSEPSTSPDDLPAGIEMICGAGGFFAEGDAECVTALRFTMGGDAKRLACDTIILAIGAVPSVELAAASGCALRYEAGLGGWVPAIDTAASMCGAGMFCAGDCAGLRVGDHAAAFGITAARAALAYLDGAPPPASQSLPPGSESEFYRLRWAKALMQTTAPDTLVCLCEEVTRAEILGVRPPRYLGCGEGPIDARDSQSLLRDGPLNPDQIKRLTRAGMGPCQGRRCREQIALMLALKSQTGVAGIPVASYRAPVRPLPLSVLADGAETPAMRTGWDVWFGIRSQWVPYDAIGTPEEAALLAAGGTQHA